MSNRPSTTRTKATSARVAHARQAEQSSNKWWLIGALVLVISGALIVAMVVSTRNQEAVSTSGQASAGFNTSPDAPPDLTTAPVTVEGTNLPQAPQGGPDPAVGQPAPGLTGQLFNGEAITIPASGQPKVVMFVAHWCPHCQKEVPVITGHLGGQLPTDVSLYAVSTGVNENQPNYPPGAWLRREDWPVPTLVDDGQGTAAEAYGLSSYPFFVAVDSSGKVVERASGELSPQQFDALVNAARTGTPANVGPAGA